MQNMSTKKEKGESVIKTPKATKSVKSLKEDKPQDVSIQSIPELPESIDKLVVPFYHEGRLAIEIIAESESAYHCKFDDGTTAWVPKK